jgi:hypothetical protein
METGTTTFMNSRGPILRRASNTSISTINARAILEATLDIL